MQSTYTTRILGFGNNAGIEIPKSVLLELGAGKRAQLNVKVNNYTFKSTMGNMAGMTLISFSKAHRIASGYKAGDEVSVSLSIDSGYRDVDIPKELNEALKRENLTMIFTNLSYSRRKEFCRQVNEAKSIETKDRRLEKIVDQLKTEIVK